MRISKNTECKHKFCLDADREHLVCLSVLMWDLLFLLLHSFLTQKDLGIWLYLHTTTNFILLVSQWSMVSVREKSNQLSLQTKAQWKADSGYCHVCPFGSLCSDQPPCLNIPLFSVTFWFLGLVWNLPASKYHTLDTQT